MGEFIFLFRLAGIWCLFQLSVGHSITYWLATRGSETKNDTTLSTVIINEKEKKIILSVRKQDEANVLSQIPVSTIDNTK
jgi:hypothetical protein